MQCDFGSFPDDVETSVRRRTDQVLGKLGLSVDDHLLPGELVDLDADQALAIGEVEACLHQPFAIHPRREPELLHQVGRDAFQHAGADPSLHMFTGLPLDDDGVDARLAQQMPEQEPGGPGANNGDLCPHPNSLFDSKLGRLR